MNYELRIKNFLTFASNGDPDQGIGCGEGFGPIAKILCGIGKGQEEKVGERVNVFFSGIFSFLIIIASLWFIFQFLRAGYQWIGAGGDKQAVESAVTTIRNALIGIIVVVGAWVIVGVLGTMLGLELLNPGELILKLRQ